MMKDCSGQNLVEGQTVATNYCGYTMNLELFEVVGFTEKKVRLRIVNKRIPGQVVVILKFPEQVSVVNVVQVHRGQLR